MSDTTVIVNAPLAGAEPQSEDVALKARFAKSLYWRRIRSLGLVAPLFIFIMVTFVIPIGVLLYQGVYNDTYESYMPKSPALLQEWNGEVLPSEEIFAAFVEDLRFARETKEIGKVATHMNRLHSGARGLIKKAARKAKNLEAPFKENLIAIDDRWSDIELWRSLKIGSRAHTTAYVASAVDMTLNYDGSYSVNPKEERVYVNLLVKTLWISFVITLFCLVLAYPVAWLLAVLPLHKSNMLMILVLLPFWTSLLVHTTAWIVVLQGEGVLNDIFVATGITSDDDRFVMVYNMKGTVIAMTHELLPFMILPLYSVMKGISPSYVRAAKSLGASDWRAFWKIYFPLTVPGIAAGALLVFILAIGYYITPALIGGEDGQLLSNIIDFHMKKSLNWSLAAALGAMLLLCVLVFYWIYDRLIGINNMKLG